jgi:serine/threonine protein phosphatase PrpC
MSDGTALFRASGWEIAAGARQGRVRPSMQDRFAVLPDVRRPWLRGAVAAVFDGVGGLPRGGEAAEAAARALEPAVRDAETPGQVMARLDAAAAATGGSTTGLVAFLTQASIRLAWCGDSSAYVLHREAAIRATAPDVDGPYLTQALGLPRSQAHDTHVEVPAGAILALCTDGVDGVVDPGEWSTLVRQGGIDGVRRLLDAVDAAGAPDNATVVLARRT